MRRRILQKSLALLLAVLLCLGAAPFAAAEETAKKSEPLIYLPDFTEIALYYKEGSDMRTVYDLSSQTFLQTLASLLAGILIASEKTETGAARVTAAVNDIFYPIAFNAEGRPLQPQVSAAAPVAKPYSLSSGDPVNKENLQAIMNAAGRKFSVSDLYVFNYDWRFSPQENAALLAAYIDEVRTAADSSRVTLLAGGYGGIIANTFLAVFPEEAASAVSRCVFLDSFLLGSSLLGDLMSGKFLRYAQSGSVGGDPFTILKPDESSQDPALRKAIADYASQDPNGVVTQAMRSVLGDQTYLSLFSSLLLTLVSTILNDEGAYGRLSAGLRHLAAESADTIYGNGLRTYLRNIPGLWALVPTEDYEDAIAFLFGATAPSDALADMIDGYHDIQLSTEETLRNASAAGIGIAIVAGYGRQILPITGDPTEQSDSIATTRYAAPGVTTKDATAAAGEIRCDVRRHKHLSKDGLIDAGTCFLPEQTWFIKNHRHMDYKSRTAAAFVGWLLSSEKSPTVHDLVLYPQFQVRSLINEEISPYMEADSPLDFTYGDINGDGAVTAEDARLTLRFAVKLEFPTKLMAIAADVDNDDYITAADARLILRFAVGLDQDFPVERI